MAGTDKCPRVSIIIPTLNAEQYFDECLTSIRAQDYPRSSIEIVIADAGSTDRTLEIARRHEVDRIVANSLKTGEAGKASALRAASGELILSIDSDNVLVGSDWIRQMVAPFIESDIWASQAVRFAYRRSDPAMFRYHALLGAGDPLAIYIGNYDRFSALTGTWTGFPHVSDPRDGWTRVTLDRRAIPTFGANGFMFRRSILPEEVANAPYFFDIDMAADLIADGHDAVALVDVAIRHYFCVDLAGYRRKTKRRVDDFMFHRAAGERSYPWPRYWVGAARFAVSTLLVVPLITDIRKGSRRVGDSAWWLHIPVCFITLGTYIAGFIRGSIRPRQLDRTGWRQ